MDEYKFNNTCSNCENHECPGPPKLTSYTAKELRQALKVVIVKERKEFERIRKQSLLKKKLLKKKLQRQLARLAHIR